MYAEPLELFGNIDELCYVSYTFCKEFILLLLKDCSDNDFGRTEVVGKALQRVGDTIICDYVNINIHLYSLSVYEYMFFYLRIIKIVNIIIYAFYYFLIHSLMSLTIIYYILYNFLTVVTAHKRRRSLSRLLFELFKGYKLS